MGTSAEGVMVVRSVSEGPNGWLRCVVCELTGWRGFASLVEVQCKQSCSVGLSAEQRRVSKMRNKRSVD